MKETVLKILREASGDVSGEQISRLLGVSRAAVWKAIEALRAEGYAISSAPRRGYRLEQPTQELCAREVIRHLPANLPWRDRVVFLSSVDSTNNYLKTLAAQGAQEGSVVIADMQTGGRGRRGRGFHSPAGMGVYLSALLRPKCPPTELMHLTCAVAEAMCSAVEDAAGFRPRIKWTNDLVSENKKLAGILTELSVEAESGETQYAVIGVGINCCQKADDFPAPIRDVAASLSMVTGKPIDRNVLAAAMIRALYAMHTSLLTDKDAIMRAYRRDCITIGADVSIVRASETRYAHAFGVDDSGALLVRFADGSEEAVNSGEVSVRGMYGYV